MESKLKQGTTMAIRRRLLNPSQPLVLQTFTPSPSDNAADLSRLKVRVNNRVEKQGEWLSRGNEQQSSPA
jgi:hypothetical protein